MSSRETCLIFIDDSNVWIEAQKFAASGNSHMPKLKDTNIDPRLRIDIGKLLQKVRRDRIQGPSFLYGSRPPPNDSVWEAYEKYNFQTNIFNRDNKGKEKEVDNSMSVGMTENATELRVRAELDRKAKERKENTIFVVITGDRDMLPAVRTVLLTCGIRVELWAWKSGISNEYLRLQAENSDFLSVRFLDSIFKDISFTAFRSTRKVNNVKGGQTIVCCEIEPGQVNAICDRLLAIRQVFYTTRFDGGADLCIEFPRVEQSNEIERIILQARKLLPDITILSWPEYDSKYKRGLRDDQTSRSSNIYELLPPEPQSPRSKPTSPEDKQSQTVPAKQLQDLTLTPKIDADSAEGDESPGNDTEEWQTVVNQYDPGKRHRSVVNQKQDCAYGIRCRKREDCTFRHTPEELRIFQQNPDPRRTNLGKHKTQWCSYAGYCNRGRDCLFAHSEDEARCLDCKQTGHFQGDSSKCMLLR